MLNMSTFFKVQMGQNRVITGVSAVDPTVRVVKRLISVKTIGFYIVSPVGKVIFEANTETVKIKNTVKKGRLTKTVKSTDPTACTFKYKKIKVPASYVKLVQAQQSYLVNNIDRYLVGWNWYHFDHPAW